MQVQHRGVERPVRAGGEHDVTLQQPLGRDGPPAPGVPRGGRVLVQAPQRGQRLVHRRAAHGRPRVAVPAAVRPLTGDEMLDEPDHALVACQAEQTGDGHRVPFLGRVHPASAVHDRDPGEAAGRRPVVEDGRRRSHRGPVPGRDAELDERDEPPVRPGPLGVRPLQNCPILQAGEQPADERAPKYVLVRRRVAEEVAACQRADGRVGVGGQSRGYSIRRWRHVRITAQAPARIEDGN
jgi:hypothetical protein